MKNLKMKKEFKVIADLLPNGTRVLDVGCGDGSLMDLLTKEKNIKIQKVIGVNEDKISLIKKNNLEMKNFFSKLGIFLIG